MKFSELSQLFLEIENISSRNIITQKLAQFFASCSPDEAKIVTYLSLGTLRPPYIKMQFNLAEKTIKKVVTKVLDNPVNSLNIKIAETGETNNTSIIDTL